jgi:hypothetical protein
MSEAESDRSLSRRSAGGEEGGDLVWWLERVGADCGACRRAAGAGLCALREPATLPVRKH